MNRDQRRALVAALAAASWVAARAVTRRVVPQDGWFNYAPSNGVAFSPDHPYATREMLVWLGFTAAWLVAALWLLRSRSDDEQ